MTLADINPHRRRWQGVELPKPPLRIPLTTASMWICGVTVGLAGGFLVALFNGWVF